MSTLRFPGSFIGLIVLTCIFVAGCKAGRPLRKTLPDQPLGSGLSEKSGDQSVGWGGPENGISAGLPFYATDTTVGGEQFTAIYLRNPDFDSLAYGIVKSYEPFAGSMLKMIAGQDIKGVLLDFRRDGSATPGESGFQVDVQQEQGFQGGLTSPIRVIFLWDGQSAARAAGFMDELKNTGMLSVKNLYNKDPNTQIYRQDCFKSGFTDFSGQ